MSHCLKFENRLLGLIYFFKKKHAQLNKIRLSTLQRFSFIKKNIS